MKKVSISIVTHNNQGEIVKLLESIYKYTKGIDLKIFITDNASSDDTVSLVKKSYKDVKVFKLKENKGFSYAHNYFLEELNSDFHVILNPDIKLTSNIINELVCYLEKNQDVVLVTPKLFFEDGKEQHLPKKEPKFKYLLSGRLEKYFKKFSVLRKEYTMQAIKGNKPFEIDFCTGCFMVFKTEVFKKVGGFDNDFFMYFEDADISKRAKKYGKIMFYPEAHSIHTWKRTSKGNFKFFIIHIVSMFKYFIKWNLKKGN